MPYRTTIAAAYDLGVWEEATRLEENCLREAECRLIMRVIDEYIASGSTVVDIGSGPGRYADYLLKRNCKIGLVDLSQKSLDVFALHLKKNVKERQLLFCKKACASELDWIPENLADAVLLMGPLYHLTDETHRNRAIAHCKRILKLSGILIAVFLSPFPLLLNSQPQHNYLSGRPTVFNDKYIGKELSTQVNFQGYEVPQYRCWPFHAEKLIAEHGFGVRSIKNIEGVASLYDSGRLNDFTSAEMKNKLFCQLNETASDEQLLGITHQYVLVAQKTS